MRLVTSTERRPQSLNAVAAEIAAAVFVHVSFWLLVLSMLSIRLAPFAIVALALLPVLLYLVARIPGFGNLTPVYVIFLPLLAGMVGMRYFGKGFRELFNYLARSINQYHELALFPVGDGYPEEDLAPLPAQWALLLLAFLVAGLFAYAICRKKKVLAVPLTVVPALAAFVAGLRPNTPAFIFFLVSATFYLILLETRSKGTARRLTWLNGEISAALLLFLLLLALLLSGFERSERIEDLRQYIAERVTTYRYAPDEATDGMPGGDLNRADSLQYDGKTVLTVETPNAFSMYLRGFSGDVLEDGRWKPLSSDAYFHDYSLTGPWVRSNYFSPAISLGQLLDLKWQVQTTQYEKGERKAMTLPRYPVTITNERAYSDRFYAPYEISAESKGLRHAELSQEGLKAEGFKGKRSYELIVYHPLTEDYGNVSSKALIGEDAPYNSLYEDAFVPTEKVYRAFVRENELEVPEQYDEVLRPLARQLLGTAPKASDAVLRIRSYYARNYTFSLDVPKAGSGTDPLLEFLQNKTGYDAHFASLAVLLLREANIPARYAEGYYLSDDLLADVPEETEVTVEVPDKASHAWVELYKDGVGWVPVEMTPGYFETEQGSQSAGKGTREEVVQPEEVPEPEDSGDGASEEGGGGGDARDESPGETKSKGFLWLLLPVLLLLLLAPLVDDTLRRRRIANADTAETVELAYRYLMRMLRLWGLKPDPHRPREVAPLLGDRKDEYLETLGLIYKNAFSEEGLTAKERERACDGVLELTADRKLLRQARKTLNDKTKKKPNREEHHGQ